MDKIMEYFIKEPEKEFHVRQVSRLLKKSPTTMSKYLKALEKDGLLYSKRKFNHLFFKANVNNRKFKLLKLNYKLKNVNLEVIDDLIKYVEKKIKRRRR